MTVMNIHIYGDSVLRAKAEPIEQVTEDIRRLVADMAETMYSAGGIGLAANQVGVLQRLVVIDVDQVESESDRPQGRRKVNPAKRKLIPFLNPEIVGNGAEDGPLKEGCLSIPGLEGEVYRPLRVKVRFEDLNGAVQELEAEGLLARVLQHEIDHLNGVLFIDRMAQENRRTLAGELSKLRKLAEQNPQGIPAAKVRK